MQKGVSAGMHPFCIIMQVARSNPPTAHWGPFINPQPVVLPQFLSNALTDKLINDFGHHQIESVVSHSDGGRLLPAPFLFSGA
jgi:hypothetical protein